MGMMKFNKGVALAVQDLGCQGSPVTEVGLAGEDVSGRFVELLHRCVETLKLKALHVELCALQLRLVQSGVVCFRNGDDALPHHLLVVLKVGGGPSAGLPAILRANLDAGTMKPLPLSYILGLGLSPKQWGFLGWNSRQ